MRLRCRNCSYEWDYQGNSEYYATCPRCLRKVKVEKPNCNESNSSSKALRKEAKTYGSK